MTVLGKILVIVNAVFAVVAFFLIIAVHTTSTNWHALAVKNEAAAKVAAANADTYKEEISAAVRTESDKFAKQKTEFDQVKSERDRLAQDAKDWENRYNQEVVKSKTTDVSREGLTMELNRRKDEVEKLQQIQATNQKKIVELEKDKQEFRNRAVAGEIAARSEQERNQQLLTQNEMLTKELQRAQAAGTGVAGGAERNPPPEDVEGVVKATDSQSGYITITIGSDAGLSKGNTLEVYRLKPNPQYLGTLRILDVRPNEAVAKLVGSARRGQIQVGDRVSSNINTRR
jgi:hypothetical protein